jgi:predicted RNA-binding Zn-ribbon protein involved in translation (DUF1610 family)
MVVLCANPGCGAVLRAAAQTSPTQTVVHLDENGCYFQCPRCAVVTRLPREMQQQSAWPATGTKPG